MQRWDTIPVKNNSSKMTGTFDKVGQQAERESSIKEYSKIIRKLGHC